MSDNGLTTVKVGLSDAQRGEITLDVEDVTAFEKEFEQAVAGTGIWWVTDTTGRRHGIVADKVAYVDIEAPKDRTSVGFG